jgi:hypothetical protein
MSRGGEHIAIVRPGMNNLRFVEALIGKGVSHL